MSTLNSFNAKTTLDTPLGQRTVYKLDALKSVADIETLPFSIKVLLEACLRNLDGYIVTEDAVKAIARYNAKSVGEVEIPFNPGRVVLQDFTGVPCVVDLAAMRSAMVRMGGDPAKVNPLVPCDLVIDHSVQVDAFGSGQALTINSQHEFERNSERYSLLKWAQGAYNNFSVVPPATGIVHQVNLEYLAKVVWDKDGVLYPDSLVGTDSHTTMINGLGVVGWGVGGIEAEAVMLGQPIYMLIPEVVGFKLTGKLREGATATDLVLVVTQILRKHGVVNKFVEFWGPGLDDMPVANRATIANMAPEYGATIGFFPVDKNTLTYMHLSGRDEKLIAAVEQYCKLQGLWRDPAIESKIVYSSTLELDMSTVEPSLAGPKRPQDRVALTGMKSLWTNELKTTYNKPRSGAKPNGLEMESEGDTATAVVNADLEGVEVTHSGKTFQLKNGAVVIAAITSCTNTSNPDVMVAAGLVARKARGRGLSVKPWVKTSLAPGSKVVTEYLNKSKLTEDLDFHGFQTVGYGCTTCIGNSGPLPEPISKAIQTHDLAVASVLSGNRNFEGRVHADVKANFLASPPLVVAYALAGTVDIDLTREPVGTDPAGRPVMLSDIWPSQQEIADTVARCVTRNQFVEQYANVFNGSDEWQAIEAPTGALYKWDAKSTYVQEPPFFVDLSPEPDAIASINGARCLVKVGDSVTTDHISPAGSIKKDSPAGKYLIDHGVSPAMFNSYGSRRGNDRVMTRGTYANIRVKNQLAPGTEGGWTTYFGESDEVTKKRSDEVKSDTTSLSHSVTQSLAPGSVTSIYEASMEYQKDNIPLIVLAGKDYGMGSSRDWAAKGVFLLGVKAAIAESFERIHRSNLVGMGVLPLCYKPGETAATLGLDGTETFDIAVDDKVKPRQDITVTATKADGTKKVFTTTCRIDTPVEVDYYRNGGILQTVLRRMAKE
ncbi:MAG: aconitate hydratase AcnA [Phycisphaeraceae bacterium]